MMTRDTCDVTGKVVVITGGSSGLGAALGGCFAERGASVVLAARRGEKLDRVVAGLPNALGVVCDVTVEASCEALIDTVISTYGRIDVLVNNAGAHATEPAETEPLDSFRSVLETNLVSTFSLSRLAARHMIPAGGGTIVNVASIFGLLACGAFPETSYVASKTGVVGLTGELAAQWARTGVRVNAVAPAYFDSEMTTDALADDRFAGWVRRRTPMGRPGRVEELFGPILFLASEASSYVTGAVLPVDGGWTAV